MRDKRYVKRVVRVRFYGPAEDVQEEMVVFESYRPQVKSTVDIDMEEEADDDADK